jgi:release factor glutamine methyltransferase
VNLAQALQRTRDTLSHGAISDGSIEAEVLLRHATGLTRTQLYLAFHDALGPEEEKTLESLVKRRLAGEPVAYITGHREFYGLDFKVDPRVLIPRPETELLVDKAIELGQSGARTFADVGTGSGCIAVSVSTRTPDAWVYAIDLSQDALDVASENCRRLGVQGRVHLLQGDLLGPLPGPVDVIMANLPYVNHDEVAMVNTGQYEPRLALDGGWDGLDQVRRLVRQATSKLNPHGSLLMEIGQGQDSEAFLIAGAAFPSARINLDRDLADIRRLLRVTLE